MSAFNAFSLILSPSWKSMARLVLPSRLELKRPEGSSNAAPLAKVSFTTALYVSPVQMIPSCSHTGTPSIEFEGFLHFTSSTTSGSACLMIARTRASVSPRQSPNAAIFASISRVGEAPPLASFEPLLLFMDVAAFFTAFPFIIDLGHDSILPLSRVRRWSAGGIARATYRRAARTMSRKASAPGLLVVPARGRFVSEELHIGRDPRHGDASKSDFRPTVDPQHSQSGSPLAHARAQSGRPRERSSSHPASKSPHRWRRHWSIGIASIRHQLFFFVHAFFIHRLSEATNQCTSEQTSVYSRQHLLQVCKELLPRSLGGRRRCALTKRT